MISKRYPKDIPKISQRDDEGAGGDCVSSAEEEEHRGEGGGGHPQVQCGEGGGGGEMLQLGGFDWRLNCFYAEEHPCWCHLAITQFLSTSAWNSTFPQPRLSLLHTILSLSTAVQPDALAPVVGLWWVSHMAQWARVGKYLKNWPKHMSLLLEVK